MIKGLLQLFLLLAFLLILGWSWECLEDWGPFSKVAVSSIFMTFIFWFCTEVGTFLAGERKLIPMTKITKVFIRIMMMMMTTSMMT